MKIVFVTAQTAEFISALDKLKQVDMKPAGQPE